MAQIDKGYTQLRVATREILDGTAASSSIKIGNTSIVLSKIRVLESIDSMPEPYPKVDLPPADDYGTWLK